MAGRLPGLRILPDAVPACGEHAYIWNRFSDLCPGAAAGAGGRAASRSRSHLLRVAVLASWAVVRAACDRLAQSDRGSLHGLGVRAQPQGDAADRRVDTP